MAAAGQGLAEHKDELGAPLCPCRHYDDKEMEAQQGFWNCPCVPMRERKVLTTYTDGQLLSDALHALVFSLRVPGNNFICSSFVCLNIVLGCRSVTACCF